ncbi:MAG: ISKra4 family transposase, partial [Gammaproteobacteria bacterium]|nr:ISKra4 family transposase [Gammaproteobacteria bacterium]
LDEFAAAREQFAQLIQALQSAGNLELEHGDIEALIWQEGNELLRRLLQGHLDLRSAREPKREHVIGGDGVIRTHRRAGCTRMLMSLFGEVRVRRMGYGACDKESVFPLDAQLNLPRDKYSHGLRQRVGEEVTKGSFDEAVSSVRRSTGGKVAKRQSQEIAVELSQDFEAFYDGGRSDGPEQTSDPLILSEDGKGIVMRTEDLREATRKAAQEAKHKLKTRLSQGEKKNRKRMAMVATVYSIARHYRRPEAIMGLEEDAHDTSSSRPRPRNKRVWASVERDPGKVTEELFEEAHRRDPEQRRPWVMLVDGHKDQLKHILANIKHFGVEVILILDFIHVLEYLWKAAYCFHSPGTEQAEAWVAERALRILQGKASTVAGGMRRSATLRGLSDDEREAVDSCANYLLKYQDMLKYDEYLAAGLPIATGVIEGACRHLVNDRMDITGARWGLQRAEAILKLRSLKSSGDSKAYWDFYKDQTLKRNHASKYDSFPLREAA